MANRRAKWLGFAGAGLLAVVGIQAPIAEAVPRGPESAGRQPAAVLDVPTAAGRPVRVVVSVLNREPGPWTISLLARSSGGTAFPTERPQDEPIPIEPSSKRFDDSTTSAAAPVQERSFHLLVGDDPSNPTAYRRVSARLVTSSDHVQVYQDADDPAGPGLAEDLRTTYETVILPRCESWIGRPRDVDGDGRLTVLLSSRVGCLGDGGEPVVGSVRPADFQDRMPEPFGNRCDLIVIDSRLEPGPHARTVLAHEYAHAVVAGRKGTRPDGPSDGTAEEDWLDEALAHVVEARLGLSRSNLDHRVAAFRRSPERFGLVIADYQAVGVARSAGHRGAAFGFLDFCARRLGPELIARLANSPETGVAGLEDAAGEPLDRLFQEWARDEARTVDGFDRIEADGASATWTAHGTTFHVVEIDPGRAAGLRVEVDGPPGVWVSLEMVDPDGRR